MVAISRSAKRSLGNMVTAQRFLPAWPQMQVALDGRMSAEDMRAMNEAVDGEHRDPAEVVRAFRGLKGL